MFKGCNVFTVDAYIPFSPRTVFTITNVLCRSNFPPCFRNVIHNLIFIFLCVV